MFPRPQTGLFVEQQKPPKVFQTTTYGKIIFLNLLRLATLQYIILQLPFRVGAWSTFACPPSLQAGHVLVSSDRELGSQPIAPNVVCLFVFFCIKCLFCASVCVSDFADVYVFQLLLSTDSLCVLCVHMCLLLVRSLLSLFSASNEPAVSPY